MARQFWIGVGVGIAAVGASGLALAGGGGVLALLWLLQQPVAHERTDTPPAPERIDVPPTPELAAAPSPAARPAPVTPTARPPSPSEAPSPVTVNGRPLTPAQLRTVEQALGAARPGAYWYDARSGLFGELGRGASGRSAPGAPLGPLSPDASGGRTGVFVNGRQLPADELSRVTAWSGPVSPGRYWLDSDGSVGIEGSAVPLGNVWAGRGGSPADRWLSGNEWEGAARVGGMPLVSGNVDPTGSGNDIISIDGHVLDLPF